MRTKSLILGLSATALLAACNEATLETYDEVETDTTEVVSAMDSYSEMLVGEWFQQTPFTMTSGDNRFTIEGGETEYEADGTLETEFTLIVDGLPDGQNRYEVELDGMWTLVGDTLSETFTDAEVDPVTRDDTTAAVADAIRTALGTAGTTASTVTTIEDTLIVRNVPGLGELTYIR